MYEVLGAGAAMLYLIVFIALVILGILGILMPIFVIQIKNRANSINENVKKIVVLLEHDVKFD